MIDTYVQSDEELYKSIVSEIEKPTVNSQISTSDIRVMGISSTGMHDRMFTIMKLIKAYSQQQALEARIDELKRLSPNMLDVYSYPALYDRINELQAQLTTNQSKEK